MIWRKFFSAFTLLAASTLLSAAWGNKADTGNLTHNGLSRDYLLHAPDNCNNSKPMPLLIAFHGGGGKAKGFARYTDFASLANKHCFIVVYPQGVDKNWHDSRFGADMLRIDDFGFVRTLIDQLSSEYPIDSKRIYLSGMSNGGVFALQLAATHPEWFAGVATVVAQLPKNIPPLSSQQPLPSLMMINGTKDPIMPYHGGALGAGGKGRVQATHETLAYWRKRSGITTSATINTLPDRRKWDGTKVQTQVWEQNNHIVSLYKIIGGGHTWPGKGQYMPKLIVGKASREFDASETIWTFLAQQKRP